VRPLSRPLLRWHGGKWRLAPWIIGHFPAHSCYVEPFGGAASVLLQKPQSYAEIYNDLDGEVVNLLRILRSPQADELVRQIHLTPFARDEFNEAYLPSPDPLEQARRLIIKCFMGYGSNGHNPNRKTGFRSNSNRSGSTPAMDWRNYPPELARIVERLRGVVIENKDARLVMADHDEPDTLHYMDPPYPMSTRSDQRSDYVHEMTDAQHVELLDFIQDLKGMVLISGYPSAMYDEALKGWAKRERKHLADRAAQRIECLWINAQASDRLSAGPLFAVESDS
jgi:DNA adenine methylase